MVESLGSSVVSDDTARVRSSLSQPGEGESLGSSVGAGSLGKRGLNIYIYMCVCVCVCVCLFF